MAGQGRVRNWIDPLAVKNQLDGIALLFLLIAGRCTEQVMQIHYNDDHIQY